MADISKIKPNGSEGFEYDIKDASARSALANKANDTQTFSEASTRANIESGENMATLFGKIKKFFTDLKDLAFIAKDGVNSSKYLRGDGVWNKPVVEMSYADYQALELAGEVDPNVAYYLPDAPSLYPPVQDNGSATTLNNGDLPTGQTINSWFNNKVQDNASATDLTNNKLPTGQTIESYLNSNFVVGKGNYNLAHCICAGYVTGSGNYIDFFVPLLIDRVVTSITLTASPTNPHEINFYCKSANYTFSDIDTSGFSVISRRKNGLRLELKFKTTKPATEYAIVAINNLTLTFA